MGEAARYDRAEVNALRWGGVSFVFTSHPRTVTKSHAPIYFYAVDCDAEHGARAGLR